MPVKIRLTTWNINSIRIRLENLARLVKTAAPDIICLQEIKAEGEVFPLEAVRKLGFAHVEVAGFKGYNGVAILSRLKLADAQSRSFCNRNDARHLSARLPGNVILHNFYVPAGGDIPDPEANEKFAHKLEFLQEMAKFLHPASGRAGERQILVGDLNVAPLENDVWSHRQLLDVVSHTPVEVAHLSRVEKSGAWVDAARHFVPDTEQLFTWWSYRNRDWRKSDRGRRLDHIWVTPPLKSGLKTLEILKDARDWKQPSDHVPVTVTLDIR